MESDSISAWRIADAVAWVPSSDGAIVVLELSSPTAQPMKLQGTAAYIWDELDASGPIATRDLLDRIATAFEVTVDTVQSDVLALLDELRAGGLVAYA